MPAATETARISPPPAPSPELVFVNGRERRVVRLDPFTIGGQLDSDLVVIGARVSRNHAIIEKSEAEYVLLRVSSDLGAFVNAEKIECRKLNCNDRVDLVPKAGLSNRPTE